MKPPDAIFFDLDGTLIDSVPDIAVAVNAMRCQTGRSAQPEEVIRGWVGRGLSVLIHRSLTGGEDDGAEPSAHAEAIKIFRHHYRDCCTKKTTLFQGADALLRWLSSRSIKTAIVTNKPESFAIQIVSSLSIEVDLIIGAAEHRPLKPDPASLIEAADRLGVSRPWMVGDTQFDLHAARAAHIPFIGVQLEGNQGRNISDLTSSDEPVFESLTDFHTWLQEEVWHV